MQIGPHTLPNNLILAPMAGITDRPFRELCRQFGVGLAVSEMVASNPDLQKHRRTLLKTDYTGETGFRSVQILGTNPQQMADAALLNQQAGLSRQIRLHQSSIEQFCDDNQQSFDLIICHAVLEWAENPQSLISRLSHQLQPGGQLSLMFYNQHSLVLRNALRGNLRKVKRADWSGDGKGLTPYQPLDPEQVYVWMRDSGFEITETSGIRCFYDYLPPKVRQSYAFEDILELERNHYRQQPYIHMARYIHVLATGHK